MNLRSENQKSYQEHPKSPVIVHVKGFSAALEDRNWEHKRDRS